MDCSVHEGYVVDDDDDDDDDYDKVFWSGLKIRVGSHLPHPYA